jgi:sortase A
MSSAAPAPSFLPGSATSRPRPTRDLLNLSLRRPGGRRSLTALATLLVVASVGMFAFPSITDLLGGHRQGQLVKQFTKPHYKTVYRHHRVPVGGALTKLIINNPRVKVNVLVVEGTSVAALRAGAGHYPATPYPCGRAGNVGIAGHRTTYGRPFNRINEMRPGDTVTLVTPVSRCTYQVVPPQQIAVPAAETSNPFIVMPNNVSVVSQHGVLGFGHWLTLTSCAPPGSATQRIVLRLSMVRCKGKTCPAGVSA